MRFVLLAAVIQGCRKKEMTEADDAMLGVLRAIDNHDRYQGVANCKRLVESASADDACALCLSFLKSGKLFEFGVDIEVKDHQTYLKLSNEEKQKVHEAVEKLGRYVWKMCSDL